MVEGQGHGGNSGGSGGQQSNWLICDNTFSASWTRQSGSSTDAFGSRPKRHPPAWRFVLGPPFVVTDDELARIADGIGEALDAALAEVAPRSAPA